MKEGLIKDTYEVIIKELQGIIAASYVMAVGIGMLFNYQKYSEFDINIFHYADVFDFLIAPFSDFYILFFTTISLLMVALIVALDSLWRKTFPKSYSIANFGRDKKPWFNIYRMILFLMSLLVYLYSAADYYGNGAKERIKSGDDISIILADDQIKSGKLIGKTKDVIFLLNEENVSAFPIDSMVKEIKIR